MSKHLQIFATESAYTAGEHDYPNVSYVEESGGSLVFAESAPTPPTPTPPTGGTWMQAETDFDSSLHLTWFRLPKTQVCNYQIREIWFYPGTTETGEYYKMYTESKYLKLINPDESEIRTLVPSEKNSCTVNSDAEDNDYYYFQFPELVRFGYVEGGDYGYDTFAYLELFVVNN